MGGLLYRDYRCLLWDDFLGLLEKELKPGCSLGVQLNAFHTRFVFFVSSVRVRCVPPDRAVREHKEHEQETQRTRRE